MNQQQAFRPTDLARYLLCLPFFIMLLLMLIEAALHAATTYLVIQAGRDVAQGKFLLADLLWILATESAAYIIGALSWIFAERTGFLAYGRYTLRFARDNRAKTKLLGDKEARERVEPFLTGFKNPEPVSLTPDGALLVGDWGSGKIYSISAG